MGVSANITSYNNPFRLILDEYTENDFIVVKLDVDTPTVEIPMAKLLLEDDSLASLVDVFYFEHHVPMRELNHAWNDSVVDGGSMLDSINFFAALRRKGILAHYWV